MKRAKIPSHVLTLPLSCEPWQRDYLDKLFRVSGNIYNSLVADRLGALKQLERTKVWKSVQARLSALYEQREKELTGKKRDFFLRTKVRDIAIVTLFLGTGIRVSECVGLDLNDVNFRENSIRIVRKGGNEAVLYFGEEVEKALFDYIEGPRAAIAAQALPGEENALFFSLQKKRISVHAVENLVEKYAREFVPQKKITPHKLRSTFGTSLYQETEDIYLVADVLGHSDVGTTRKHYAAIKDQNRRKAARTIKLRDS